MEVRQQLWNPALGPVALQGWADAHVVFVFAPRAQLTAAAVEVVSTAFPEAILFGGSTAGEILGTRVLDGPLSLTAVRFDRARVRGASADLADPSRSADAGAAVAATLAGPELRHVLVLSDGIRVNGSRMVEGLRSALPAGVTLSGGLCADGADFGETLVLRDGRPATRSITALGLYGSSLRIGCGSLGGWDPFGPERVITRSDSNVLHELDGRSALDLYKQYLGPHAEGLPATALLFPLSVRDPHRPDEAPIVRTVLGVDDEANTMTFAGEMPTGAFARLMKANFDRLIDGALGAATAATTPLSQAGTELALLISCVGRRLVLKQRAEEEVEAARDALGEGAALCGFYSYGEISPFTPDARCELHNQTMTVTALSETDA